MKTHHTIPHFQGAVSWQQRTAPVNNHPELDVPSQIFTENMKRVHSLAIMPGQVFADAENWCRCLQEAMRALKCNDREDEKVAKFASGLMDKFNEIPINETHINHFYEALTNSTRMLCLGENGYSSLKALLHSMVILTCAAIETLAKDAWKATVLGRAHLNPPLTDRQSKQCGFGSTPKIRNRFAFSLVKNHSEVLDVCDCDEIESVFLLRNILVHKDSMVDSIFRDRADKIVRLQEILNLPDDERVHLKGGFVRIVIDDAVEKCYELLLEIDTWLTRNP